LRRTRRTVWIEGNAGCCSAEDCEFVWFRVSLHSVFSKTHKKRHETEGSNEASLESEGAGAGAGVAARHQSERADAGEGDL